MLRNLSSLATFLSLTVRASVYPVTCGGLRKQQCAKIRRNIRSGTRHSRSFKVIHIGVSRNPKQGVVVMYNNVDFNLKLVKILQQLTSAGPA